MMGLHAAWPGVTGACALVAALSFAILVAGCGAEAATQRTVRAPPASATAPAGGAAVATRHEDKLTSMHEACVTAMIKSTCTVMGPEMQADASSTVFIAGVGRVDADAYRSLRASGDAMCSVARDACKRAWDGAQCQSARALWTM
jgi:PBP1b-binding outer membrane lipoprotein LpoB